MAKHRGFSAPTRLPGNLETQATLLLDSRGQLHLELVIKAWCCAHSIGLSVMANATVVNWGRLMLRFQEQMKNSVQPRDTEHSQTLCMELLRTLLVSLWRWRLSCDDFRLLQLHRTWHIHHREVKRGHVCCVQQGLRQGWLIPLSPIWCHHMLRVWDREMQNSIPCRILILSDLSFLSSGSTLF